MKHTEEDIQIACVKFFELQYPQYALSLHHSPNGGYRNAREAARFKRMGTRAGFPDLFLAIPSDPYHGLFIEMKTEIGRQSPAQKNFEKRAIFSGYKYAVCRSVEEFIESINDYLNIKQ